MSNPAPARVVPPPEDPGPLTYFLLPDDEVDEQAAREFLEARYGVGGTKTSKRVTVIRIGRLTEEHSVIAIVRRNPQVGLTKEKDPETRRVVVSRIEPVIGMVECAPVHCCDYWEPSSHEDGDGLMNMARFLEALGKTCSPMAPRYRPDDQILRLRFT